MANAKKRAALWHREAMNSYVAGDGYQPICNLCGRPVRKTDAWDESHDPARPRCFGGRRTAIAHLTCNREHGAQVVTPAFAKSNRVHQRSIGAAGPGLGKAPMRGGKRDRVTRTFRNGLQPRLTLAQKHRDFLKRRYGAFTEQPETSS